MNSVTRNLIKCLKRDENLPELGDIKVRPTLKWNWLTMRLLLLLRSDKLAEAVQALRTIIEEECVEGGLPAWCKSALDDDSVDWCAVLQAVLRWK